MNKEITSQYYYTETQQIVNSKESSINKFVRLYSLFKEALKELTEDLPQFFPTIYSRLAYFINENDLPEDLELSLKKFKLDASKVKNKNSFVSRRALLNGVNATVKTLSFFTQEEPPADLLGICEKAEKITRTATKIAEKEKIDLIGAVVLGKGVNKKKRKILICETEKNDEVKIVLSRKFDYVFDIVWKGAVINALNARVIDDSKKILKTVSESYVILQPDYLIDATELAECFISRGFNAHIYFLKRFGRLKVSDKLLAGNLINSLFDSLILNFEADYNESLNKALKETHLQAFALASENPQAIKEAKRRAEECFPNLKKAIQNLEGDIYNVEPSFISPKFGLQGRLDLMIEFSEDERQKNVVELKSGSQPSKFSAVKDENGAVHSIGLWNNHLAQVACYNILLDSAYEERKGSSAILYAASEVEPYRDAPNLANVKQRVLKARNIIISLENDLLNGNYSIFEYLTPEKFGPAPPYMKKQLEDFDTAYHSADFLEKEYFQKFFRFILGEIYCAKLGSKSRKGFGFSSLWLEAPIEKKDALKMLTELTISKEKSDFDKLRLELMSQNEKLSLTSLRKGDLAILYSISKDGDSDLLRNQIFKCAIKEIDENSVRISLRNKQIPRDFFEKHETWNIEPDYLDAGDKKIFSSLFEVLSADNEKRQILFGLKKPRFKLSDNVLATNINDNQKEIVENALAAEDYYLIQGPPGTGKTSRVLKAIVENLYLSSEGDIIVLAYTNRAVDEICSVLKDASVEIDFLRTGAKEVSEHKDVLISELIENLSMNEVYERIKNVRVIVSTVTSVLTNSEIRQIKNFEIAIIDEASQILEPQIIGLLSEVKKFVMIGDEKQLPAIVSQEEKNLEVGGKLNEKLSFLKLNDPIFLRLIRQASKNGWSEAYGMLTLQARMHVDIQNLANEIFYDGKLAPFQNNDWQVRDDDFFDATFADNLEKDLSRSRTIFIESQSSFENKRSSKEAKLVAKIVELIKTKKGGKFDEKSVGVITPFRAQCAEIKRALDSGIRKLVTVDTVERFQGSERETIIISFALSYSFQLPLIQSLTESDGGPVDRKLNVALTRAKKRLILVGNPIILYESNIYKRLIDSIRANNGYVSSIEL